MSANADGKEDVCMNIRCTIGKRFYNSSLQNVYMITLERMINGIVPKIASELHDILEQLDETFTKALTEIMEEAKGKGEGR